MFDKMCISGLVILVFGVKWSLSGCDCGRGGLCKVYNDENPSLAVSAQPCSCAAVSRGIFTSVNYHCNTMVPRCRRSSCGSTSNLCKNGFGAVVCICSRNKEGHVCQYNRGIGKVIYQVIHLWYPVSRWSTWVPIIATSLPLQDAVLIFKFKDNRMYETNEQICRQIPIKSVLSRCGQGPDCQFIIHMGLVTRIYYECPVTIPFHFRVYPYRGVYIRGVLGPVGHYHDVDVAIVQNDNIYLKNNEYRVFLETGPFIRKCPYLVKFSGCNGDPESANEYISASKVVLSCSIIPVNDKVVCPVKEYSFRWSISHLKQYQNLKPIGDEQLIAFRPYDLALYYGTFSVQVDIGFLGSVDMPDEKLTTMCYLKLDESIIEVSVAGFSLVYECGTAVNIILSATISASSMPAETYNFDWDCPIQLCGSTDRKQPTLDFWTNVHCRGVPFHQVKVVVSHNRSRETGHFIGTIQFSPDPHNIIVVCDPDCNKVIPGRQLKIVAQESPDEGSIFEWILPKGVEVDANCRHSSNNSVIVKAHNLKPGTTYEFVVISKHVRKRFDVVTLSGPEHVSCIVVPSIGHPIRDKFNVTCYADSQHQPLTYIVYEGDNLVVTSSSSKMTNLEITDGRITIKVVDSAGVAEFFKYEINLQNLTEDELLEARDEVPVRIEQLILMIHAKDYNGVANEVDSITKLSLIANVSSSLKLKLWDAIGQIRNCTVMDCIVKALNSVKRLLSTKTTNYTTRVDDFVFKAGAALYSITHFLNYLDDKEIASDAYGYHSVLGAIHDAAIKIMEFVDPVLMYPFLDEEIRRIHYRKVQAGTTYARMSLLKMGEFVTNRIAYLSPPFEHHAGDNEHKIIIISHNTEYINCFLALDRNNSNMQFTMEAMRKLNIAGSRAAIVVIHYSKKDFWWAQRKSVSGGNMIDVFVFHVVRKKWVEWKGDSLPVSTQITAVNVPKWTVNGTVVKPTDNMNITDLDSYVNVHRVSVPRGYGSLHLVFPDHLVGRVRVLISMSDRPNYSILNDTEPLQSIDHYHEYYSAQAGNKVYIGIWSQERSSFNYSFDISLVRCVLWEEQQWKSESCYVVGYEWNNTVKCNCRHMSLFNVVASVSSVDLIPFLDITLETRMYYNWAVLGVIFCVLVLFSLLLGVIYFLDKREKRTATFLEDNYPRERYPYLVAVFTGGRYSAGTSAKVAIRLFGDKYVSRVHILNPVGSVQTLENRQDSWFILFTKRRLGDIKEIVFWHDNTGPAPDWYCTEVVIWDIHLEENYIFKVKTWITYGNLFKKGETTFVFVIRDYRERKTFGDKVGDLFFSYMRQSHHWVSIFTIHPRSLYSRLDRTILALIFVLGVIAVSLVYIDKGPADSPTIAFPGFGVTCISLISSVLVVTTVAQMFRIGKNEVLEEQRESVGLVEKVEKIGMKAKVKKYLIFPITYLPIITSEPLTQVGNRMGRQWMMPRRWILAAYITSGIVIIFCVVLIVVKGWGMGHNICLMWITVFMMAIFVEAFVLDPILVATTTLLVAVYVEKTSLDLVEIGVDPYEDTIPFLERNKRLTNALHQRVKPCYKPPLWSKVKAVGSLPPTSDYLKTSVTFSILLLSFSLIFYHAREHDFYMNKQSNEIFTRSKSLYGTNLDSVRNRTRYFDYLKTTVMPALHYTTWYNGKRLKLKENILGTSGFCADYSTKLVGVPRLRQQRVSLLQPLVVPKHFKNDFPYAYSYLTVENEDTKTYLPSWITPKKGETYYGFYKYSWPEATGTGKILSPAAGSFISGGGYVETLHWSLGKSLGNLVDLELDGWLDNATRYVLFTFNLYNLNIDKISYVTIVTECLPSGVYRSRTSIASASLSLARMQWKRGVIIVISILSIVLTIHSSMTLTVISQHGFRSYVNKVGGMMNIALIITGYGVIVASANRYTRFVASLEEINAAALDAYTPVYWRFFQNEIYVVFIATFSLLVAVFCSLNVHMLLEIEAIDKVFHGIRTLIVIRFIGLMALFVTCTFSAVSLLTDEIPHFFFLLSFKESSPQRPYVGSALYYIYFTFVTVLYIIYTKFNAGTFYKMYAEAVHKPILIGPIIPIKLRPKTITVNKNEMFDGFDARRSVSRQMSLAPSMLSVDMIQPI